MSVPSWDDFPEFSGHCSTMIKDDYQDTVASLEYLWKNGEAFLTEFEQRCLTLAAKLESAINDRSLVPQVKSWLRDEDDSVIVASSVGLPAVRRQIEERFARCIADGSVVLNRCPKCDRVACSPVAQQCTSCGNSWRDYGR